MLLLLLLLLLSSSAAGDCEARPAPGAARADKSPKSAWDLAANGGGNYAALRAANLKRRRRRPSRGDDGISPCGRRGR